VAIDSERELAGGQEVGPSAAVSTRTEPERTRSRVPGAGLMKGLGVTLKHMLQRSITQEYPEERPNLPPRTRGVIALKQANCTVCYLCSRECPDWCIYIDAHKETHPPAGGGKARSVKVLDRFAIDYALCMYCGICVEVCPFDALFWSPEFEYAEYDILEMTHEKDRLEEWTYKVLPPPDLEIGAEPPVATEGTAGPAASPEASAPAAPPTEAQVASPAAAVAPPAAVAPAATPGAAPPEAPVPAPARPAGPAEHVEPDQETYDQVLAEELAKGTDRRVAEGRAKAAAIRAARKKAAE
jgi:NADH-quinone oxidoreductase subunit I